MQVDVCIQTRRSVRKYSDQDISGDTLREIVDLARFSPSWKNTQVVRCNALVIVSVVTKVSGYEPDGSYSTTQEDRWEMFDAGIANQTFCLAAHSKGVGSVILGVFDENKIRQYLTLPDNERVTNLIALGYPLEGAKNAPPRKEVSQLLEIVE